MALHLGRSRLSYLFKSTKKTQTQLADHLGVSQGFISQVANGKAQFSIEMAGRAAEFFKCRIEELYEWERD